MNVLLIFFIDLDECASFVLNTCDDPSRARCINTFGSFICDCRDVFTGNGTICEGNLPMNNYIIIISLISFVPKCRC